MKVFCFVDRELTNFGDDLNSWLWSRLLNRPTDVENGTFVLGIGTVISELLVPDAQKYIVISSGVGYSAAPKDFGGPAWHVLSVRGPLTATVLGLPKEKGIVDGAALLRLLPECTPLPEAEREGIVFMPHHGVAHSGNWEEICKLAGLEFLSPHEDSQATVQRIRRAKLVLADSMHAAIVADVLRVPWIPVVLSPHNNTFKWLDWTMSLNVPYRPVKISAPTVRDAVWCASCFFCGEKNFVENSTPEKAIKHYWDMRRKKEWKHFPLFRWRMVQLTRILPERIMRVGIFKKIIERQDKWMTRRAAEQLRRAAKLPFYLSDEEIFKSKLDALASLLPQLASFS